MRLEVELGLGLSPFDHPGKARSGRRRSAFAQSGPAELDERRILGPPEHHPF
jgi:hypothetical protein